MQISSKNGSKSRFIPQKPDLVKGFTESQLHFFFSVANNINSNNNNLNDQNINFQMSSNTVVTGNVNVANQINIMNMAGRKKRAAHLGTIHILRNHLYVGGKGRNYS